MTYVQTNRLAAISTPLGPDALLLVWMTGEEALSQLFSYSVDVVSTRLDIAMDEIIGKKASIRVDLADGSKRHFHGIVAQFEQGGTDQRFGAYRLELRPHLWLLTRRADCRIYQGKSVPDIVKDVLDRAGITDVEFRISGAHAARGYCVQYRETDFAFVSRLLEDEGIYYFFQHHEDRHVLVLTDAASTAQPCPNQAEAYCAGDSGGLEERDEITAWRARRRLHSGKVALKDYNFEDPTNALDTDKATATTIGDNSKLEVYDHDPCDYGTVADGATIAGLRMEELETAAFSVEGESGCRAFATGFKFTVKNHAVAATDGKEFLISALTHRLTQPSPYASGGSADSVYENSFQCVPADAPFRPARVTPRPRIAGPQTAMVVGPSGEEIHVDKYGRVLVQFPWDRLGKKDEKSSCWVRVTQAWASKQFGFFAHPRIGDEVIVEFLEGDPDRPIITGCVYNAQTMPPYELPANKTRTGVKTRSSKGAGPANFNEIRFEDKKGSEEVYIHAEKDQNTVIENDQTVEIGHDQSVTIGHDQTLEVGNDQSATIAKNRTLSVGENETTDIGANRTESVGKKHDESIGDSMSLSVGKSRSMSIGTDLSETVGGSMTLSVSKDRTTSISGKITVDVGKDAALTIGGKQTVAVSKEASLSAKKIQLTADDEISFVTGSASFTLKKNGDITIKGKKITVQGSGDVVIKGSKVTQN